jgi:hypothetical protein
MIRNVYASMVAILFLLAASGVQAQEPTKRSQQEEAAYRLKVAHGLYQEGDYQNCLSTLDSYVADHKSKTFVFPHGQMAEVYRLRALLAYAFRGEGEQYRQEVRDYLLAALVEDPEVELGSPSEVPAFVQEMFYEVREDYLGRYSRTSRRFSLGLLAALVIDPTEVTDPSRLQPGIYFSYNLSDRWSLISVLRIPLTRPIWDAIRGQAGFAWYPDFNITRINPSISLSYVFSIDNLDTFTHSLSIAGQVERISRMGLGVGVLVEALRLDLIRGVDTGELPQYRSLELFGQSALRASFANMNIFVTYTF